MFTGGYVAGMTDDIEPDVPVTSSEAHLDLLLAEELAVNSQFLRRFLEPVWEAAGAGPISGDASAVVRLNVWDTDGLPDATAAGENDIDLAVTTGSHTMRVLIEDKVWASFQPGQAERYRRRADFRGDTAVLVAPRSRLSQSADTACFHVTYAVEDLAGWLDEQAGSGEDQWSLRLRWRAAVLRRLCRRTIPFSKPDHLPTVAFTKFCTDWLAAHEPLAVANANMLRTAGNGWLYFTSPSGLIYKANNGCVDLYVADHGYTGTIDDLEAAVTTGWGPDRFVAAVDTKGNPVLRFEDPDIRAISQDGVPADTSGVEQALTAVVTAVRWLTDHGASATMP